MANPTGDKFNSLLESIALRSETTDRAIAANTKAQQENARAIAQLGSKVDKLADSIGEQRASLDRLERAVMSLVSGIREQRGGIDRLVGEGAAQRETVNLLIKLATSLVEQQQRQQRAAG